MRLRTQVEIYEEEGQILRMLRRHALGHYGNLFTGQVFSSDKGYLNAIILDGGFIRYSICVE